MHQHAVERVRDDHAETEHRADDERSGHARLHAEREGIGRDLTRCLETEPEQQPDRNREQRTAAVAQGLRQEPRLEAGDRRAAAASCRRFNPPIAINTTMLIQVPTVSMRSRSAAMRVPR